MFYEIAIIQHEFSSQLPQCISIYYILNDFYIFILGVDQQFWVMLLPYNFQNMVLLISVSLISNFVINSSNFQVFLYNLFFNSIASFNPWVHQRP